MRANYVNVDHVHALIDLPVSYSIAEVTKLLKGSSSYWINRNNLIRSHFSWGRGYGVFSVSPSKLPVVTAYIANQEEHHRHKTFSQEYNEFIRAYGLAPSKNR